MIDILFKSVVLVSMIRITAPILLVAIGGSFGQKAGVLNIGLESFMLTSAFFSMLGSYQFQSEWMGLLYGILSGLLASMVFGVFVLYLKSNPIIVGIAFNSAAWGFTTFLLDTIFGVRGVFMDPKIKSFANINIPFIKDIPFVGEVVSGHNLLLYFAYISAIIAFVVMYKTRFGLRIRGVGVKSIASETVGVRSIDYKWKAILISGLFAGIGGAYLSIGGASMFTESMSAGKGFLALAAIMIGNGNPLIVMIITLIFGYTSALSVSLQSLGIPSQLVLTTPYVITVLVLIIYAIVLDIKKRQNSKNVE